MTGLVADVLWLGWKVSNGLVRVLLLTIRAFGFIDSQVALMLAVSGGPHATDTRTWKKACRVARPLHRLVRWFAATDAFGMPRADWMRGLGAIQ